MARFTHRVRLKGTHITGQIRGSFTEGDEILYRVDWDAGHEGEQYYRETDLESQERTQHYPTQLPKADSKHRHELERLQLAQEGHTLFEAKRSTGHRRT